MLQAGGSGIHVRVTAEWPVPMQQIEITKKTDLIDKQPLRHARCITARAKSLRSDTQITISDLRSMKDKGFGEFLSYNRL